MMGVSFYGVGTLPDLLNPALLCQSIYENPAYFDQIFDNGAVYAGYKFFDGAITITCRGSVTTIDWWHDLLSVEQVSHPILGIVGSGFLEGVEDTFTSIRKSVQMPNGSTIKIYGHSLGGAHALYLAGLFIYAGFRVEVIVFETPRACGDKLVSMLAPYSPIATCNGTDFVTRIPSNLRHPCELTDLHCAPVTGDLGPFRYHHSALIVCAAAIRQGGFA